jgi:hypothetical protein
MGIDPMRRQGVFVNLIFPLDLVNSTIEAPTNSASVGSLSLVGLIPNIANLCRQSNC